MSRYTRKAVAFPRGRPMAGEPTILPFPSNPVAGTPGPALEYHSYFVVNGMPLHLVGERWLAEHAANSLSPTYPDPLQPGIELTTRIETVDGTIIQAVSYEAYQAYCLALQVGPKARQAGAILGR